MKHKLFRAVIAGCLLLGVFFSGGTVSAQEENLADPGILPDSPFYFLDKMAKGLGMFFTFGDEAKVKRALKYSEERLAEAEQMAVKNKVKESTGAAEGYEQYMEMVNERVRNRGVSANITERVCLATSHHLTVLGRIRERLGDTAGNGIANAENASVNGQLNALRALAKNKPDRALELADNALQRHLERIKNQFSAGAADNVTSANTSAERARFLLETADKIAALEDELIAVAENMSLDITPILERLANATSNRLETLSRVYENAPESPRQGLENAIQNSVRKYERALAHLQAKGISSNATDEKSVKARIKAEIRNRLHIELQGENDESETATE